MTSQRFRSPPVCSHDGRLTLLRPLRLIFSPLSSLARLLRGLGAAAAGSEPRVVGHPVPGSVPPLTAVYVSVSPQQEGLDDGPDFLSEEDRGVSVLGPPFLTRFLPFDTSIPQLAAVFAITLGRLCGNARLGANLLC